MLDCTVRPSRAAGVSLGLQLQKLLFTVRCFGRTDRSWLRLRGLEHTGEHADMTFTFTWGWRVQKVKMDSTFTRLHRNFPGPHIWLWLLLEWTYDMYQVADILYAMLYREEREGQEKQGATIRRVRRERRGATGYVISHSLFSLFTSSLRFLSIRESSYTG